MAKAVADKEAWFEVWFNRDLGRGVGKHLKADNEADALAIANELEADGHPNIEVLKVSVTRKPIERT